VSEGDLQDSAKRVDMANKSKSEESLKKSIHTA
jgi:hypothetical protein